VISRPVRLACTGLLGAGLAFAAAVWPSRPHGTTAAGASPATGVAATPERGAALFQAKGCATCHDGPSSAAAISVGPDLGELPNVAATREPGMSAEAYVRQSIRTPQAFVVAGYTTVLMPTLPVDDQELDALVRYLLG
jgi:cytochrome c oxidase subunit 2